MCAAAVNELNDCRQQNLTVSLFQCNHVCVLIQCVRNLNAMWGESIQFVVLEGRSGNHIRKSLRSLVLKAKLEANP